MLKVVAGVVDPGPVPALARPATTRQEACCYQKANVNGESPLLGQSGGAEVVVNQKLSS